MPFFHNGIDDGFKDRAVWYRKFAWLPHRCFLTNKVLWLQFAYEGTAMWFGPGSPIFEHRWVSQSQFLFAKLKGKL
jgi:hypothetical protein